MLSLHLARRVGSAWLVSQLHGIREIEYDADGRSSDSDWSGCTGRERQIKRSADSEESKKEYSDEECAQVQLKDDRRNVASYKYA
jgi:hypothetical protein